MRWRGAALSLLVALSGCLSFHAGRLPGAPKDATFAEVAGTHVRYVDRGDPRRPAVVLIHGFASALDVWGAVIPELEKTHRVLALDLRGFGWSSRPEGDYSPDAEAQLVLGLMDQRGIRDADVVAHSWGSAVALAMALRAPARVKKVALYSAWVFEEQLPTFFVWSRASGVGEALFALYYGERGGERIAYAFHDKERFVTEKLVEDVEAALDRPGTYAAALAAVRAQRFGEWQDRYRTIDRDVLLLWCREDEVTLLSHGERLARELPRARLVVYPRCGHFPMLEAAGPSTAELARFLAPAPAAPPVPVTPSPSATPPAEPGP